MAAQNIQFWFVLLLRYIHRFSFKSIFEINIQKKIFEWKQKKSMNKRRLSTPKLVIPRRRTKSQNLSPSSLKPLPDTLPNVKTQPVSDPEMENIKVSYTSHRNFSKNDIEIVFSKPFPELPPKDCKLYFKIKCNECAKICDFSNPNKDTQAKANKISLLRHIISSYQIPHIARSLSQDRIQEFYNMISSNLFREFPPVKIIDLHDGSIPDVQDASWTHLSIIYEALNGMIDISNAPDFPPNFIANIARNFYSFDSRERQQVCNTLIAISNKFPQCRVHIRKRIVDILSSNYCASAILDWMLSYANGLSIPLKQDSIDMFMKVLLPLHTLPNFCDYSKQIQVLMYTFIVKQPELFAYVANFIIVHWPIANVYKQVAFIDELDIIFSKYSQASQTQHFQMFFKFLCNLLSDQSYQVTDKVMTVLSNKGYYPIIKDHSNGIIFNLVTALLDTSANHWSTDVRKKSCTSLALLESYDANSYKKSVEAQKIMNTRRKAQLGLCKSTWQRVIDEARSNNKSIAHVNIDLVD